MNCKLSDHTWCIDSLNRVKAGRCVCCGGETENFIGIGEGIKLCKEFCVTPPSRDHRDMIDGLIQMVTGALQ